MTSETPGSMTENLPKGAETELTWRLATDWKIEARVSHLESRIDRVDITPLAVIPPGLVVGNELSFAPRRQGHLGIACTADASGLLVTPRVDGFYQARTFSTPRIQLRSRSSAARRC